MEKMTQQIKSKSDRLFTFLHALMNNPRNIGAFCPSSPYLAREMVRQVNLKSEERVVELGPGTGVITEALIQQGCPSNQILAIEYHSTFAKKLQHRFPNITVIHGDALDMQKLLVPYSQITYIVSSLPLRALPLETSKAILTQIEQVLPSGGRYIQFTYSFRYHTFGQLSSCKHVYSKWVWKNVPPARVDIWEKL